MSPTATAILGRMRTVLNEPLALSPAEAARLAGIGRTKLYEAIADGSLPIRKLGHRTLILRRDLEAFLDGLPVPERPAS
jgi:excisionase family DNA binding protein